ncbi:MAG: NAD-dependent epimerase/dehydratase family protein [Anaerolineae bacterium]|nr:NAD-dependent epimerase/dehydratase family protein [Anaerolineae bacterium]
MILVTGATGFIGRQLVARLMADGKRVRCLIPEEQESPWENPPDIITGNILDEEALFKAVTGVHVIIHLENAFWWGRPRDLERIELAGTRALIAAARAARVGRIITLSHIGAAPSSAYPLIQIKGMVEEIVRSSGLAYTIIRTGIVFGEQDAFINHIAMLLRAVPLFFLMPGRGEVVLHPIYIDDLVDVLMRSLEQIEVVDTLVEVGGPEYITLEDLIRTVMRVSRAPRVIISVPPYILRWITAVYSRVLPRSLVTMQWLDLLATNRATQLGNTYSYFGIRPRRLEDTLLTYMRGRRYLMPMLRYTFRRRPKGI